MRSGRCGRHGLPPARVVVDGKERQVKGPPLSWRRLGRWVSACGPSDGPTLTRLSYGGPGQAKEVATLLTSLRPTSAWFLSADHSKPRLQTSSGSCTKQGTRRAGWELVLVSNMAEGRELDMSVRLRHARRKAGAGPVRGRRVGVGGHALRVAARAFGIHNSSVG